MTEICEIGLKAEGKCQVIAGKDFARVARAMGRDDLGCKREATFTVKDVPCCRPHAAERTLQAALRGDKIIVKRSP